MSPSIARAVDVGGRMRAIDIGEIDAVTRAGSSRGNPSAAGRSWLDLRILQRGDHTFEELQRGLNVESLMAFAVVAIMVGEQASNHAETAHGIVYNVVDLTRGCRNVAHLRPPIGMGGRRDCYTLWQAVGRISLLTDVL